ncbi:hypothetical protein [Streptomyces sp. NPDC058683]
MALDAKVVRIDGSGHFLAEEQLEADVRHLPLSSASDGRLRTTAA